MQKSLHGLDYINTEGVQGFECLENIAGTLRNKQVVTSSWEKESKEHLSNAQRYLKADYKLHVSKDERCVDHCTVHALSSPTDPSFKPTAIMFITLCVTPVVEWKLLLKSQNRRRFWCRAG